MEKRPYFKFSIIELEKVYESSNGDIRIIEDIYNELKLMLSNTKDTVKDKKIPISNEVGYNFIVSL